MSASGSIVGRVIVLAGGAVFLFTAGLVGTLAARGKLNREYLGPMLGMSPPSWEGAEHVQQPGNPARTDQPAPEVKKRPIDAKIMPGIMVPSPFSSEETAQLFEELRAMREDLKLRLAKAEGDRRDLELLRTDLNRRWDEIDRREQELEQESRLLKGERRELGEQSVVLREAEIKNLKKLAGDVEKMPAGSAAQLLQQYEPDRAAKILALVKARESGKILAAMPPEFASKVAERMLGVTRQDGGDAEKGP